MVSLQAQDNLGAAVAQVGMLVVRADFFRFVVFPAADAFFHAVGVGARDGDGFFAFGGFDDDLGDDEEFFEDGGLN